MKSTIHSWASSNVTVWSGFALFAETYQSQHVGLNGTYSLQNSVGLNAASLGNTVNKVCWTYKLLLARCLRIKPHTWNTLKINPVKIMKIRTPKNEPHRDKTNKMACAPNEDSDQPGHPPSLIRVFAVRMWKAWVLSYPLSTQRRLWSDWADAQADLSLRWAHMPFRWFCHDAAQILL